MERIWKWSYGPLYAAAVLAAGTAGAQTHKVAAPEKVVRAVGVYEWTGNLQKPTAARLVPVTVFIDGQLQDAGVYLPQPIPFALLPGNEYELERAGVPQGLFELDYARHLQTADLGEDESWFGYGSYKAEAPPKKQAPLRASRTLPVITGSKSTADSDRPTLVRKPGSGGSSTTDTASSTATPGTNDPAADPDRPTMKRRTDTSTTASTGGSDSSTTSTPANDPDRPTLKRRTADTGKKSKGNDDAPTVTGVGSLNADPDRPTLHRGRPAGAPAEDETPAVIVGTPADLHQLAAVSDATTRPQHDFARPWSDDAERTTVLAKMQGIARAQLAAYAAATGAAPKAVGSTTITHAQRSATSTARSRAASRSRAAKPTTPTVALLDEQLKAYTLSYGGAATYIYTAHTAGTGADLRYVTVVAQAEVTGDLKAAMSSATDAAHLDRTPWMRFIDVVDAQASNRASLLFELRSQKSRQFALYQVLGDRADQLLATGATP